MKLSFFLQIFFSALDFQFKLARQRVFFRMNEKKRQHKLITGKRLFNF